MAYKPLAYLDIYFAWFKLTPCQRFMLPIMRLNQLGGCVGNMPNLNMLNNWFDVFWSDFRTKWKRQTAVGLELLAEAGNYSALQRMFPSPYFYHPSLLGTMDSTTAAAAAAAMYSSMYRTPSAPHPSLQRPLVPRVLIHGLGPGGQPALNPLANSIPGSHQR